MVVWSGFGWVVAVIAFACLLLGNVVLGDNWSGNTWAQSGAMLVAAVLTFAFNKVFSEKRTDRTLVSKETGQDVVLRKNDSLFFIPLRFWPFVLVGIAAAIKIFG